MFESTTSPRRAAWPIACALALSVAAAPAAAQRHEPWSEGPFGLTPGQLLAAAAEIPLVEGEDAHVLLDERHIVVDEQRRATSRHWQVHRIHSAHGRSTFADLDAWWSPWYQQRPEMRARVITGDGGEHWLDSETISEVPAYESPWATPTDLRVLRAPLPAVAVGAVIETEVVSRDLAPFFEAGSVFAVRMRGPTPIYRARVVVDASASLPLRYLTELLPGVEPAVNEIEGGRRWTFESGPQPAMEPVELLVPGDAALLPRVGFSTGESWAAVARHYAELVDRHLDAAEFGNLAEQVIGAAATRQAKVEAALAWIHDQARYSALPLGVSGIVPSPPAETLERKYGD